MVFGGLQFGPDGKLYGGSASGGGGTGDLYEINPATGAATFIGATGFGSITGLTLVGDDLAIGKSASPDPAFINQLMTYTLSITNNAAVLAQDVVVSDTLPANVLLQFYTTSQGSCNAAGGVITCMLGALASGSQATVEIVVIPTATGVFQNTAVVRSNLLDYRPGDNSATINTSVGLNKIYLPVVLKL